MKTFYHVTGWGWYYLGVIVALIGPEIYWIIVNSRNTISEQIWGIEHADPAHPFDFAEWGWAHWSIALSLLALVVWLVPHLVFTIWRT